MSHERIRLGISSCLLGELVRFDAPKAIVIAPGGTVRARLTFHVLDSWHVNAHRPN